VFIFKTRIEDVVKRFQKTVTTLQTLQNDIIGLMYDVKELARQYQGNLIALVIGIAIPVMNRNNAGMFELFYFQKRSTHTYRKVLSTTSNDQSVTFTSPMVMTTTREFVPEGIKHFIFRPFGIFKTTTITLVALSIILLVLCFVCCYCCMKMRVALKNRVEYFQNPNYKSSDENVNNVETVPQRYSEITPGNRNPDTYDTQVVYERETSLGIQMRSRNVAEHAVLPELGEDGYMKWPEL